jgi:hypothetical protein
MGGVQFKGPGWNSCSGMSTTVVKLVTIRKLLMMTAAPAASRA